VNTDFANMLFATLQTSLALIYVCWIYRTVAAKLTVPDLTMC